eukprot:10715883-Heterocapsa_arctica.AAC.1
MDPDYLSYERIMSADHGQGQAPTKQQLLNIFEFCTEIHSTTPIVGSSKTDHLAHSWEVKEALITLVTTYRCLGSRATRLSMLPHWEMDGIFNIFYDGDESYI